MNKPRYFISVFGNPQPGKDAVESGIYHPSPKDAPFPAEPADYLILYCTAGYPAHAMQIPGIGIVLSVGDQQIVYRWIPFAKPTPKQDIDGSLDPDDAAKLRDIRFDAHWLFEISRRSFSKIVGGRAIRWDVAEREGPRRRPLQCGYDAEVAVRPHHRRGGQDVGAALHSRNAT